MIAGISILESVCHGCITWDLLCCWEDAGMWIKLCGLNLRCGYTCRGFVSSCNQTQNNSFIPMAIWKKLTLIINYLQQGSIIFIRLIKGLSSYITIIISLIQKFNLNIETVKALLFESILLVNQCISIMISK